RYSQLQEAVKAREGLEQSLALARHRYTYFAKLLGQKDSDIQLPELDALDKDELTSGKFKSSEPAVAMPDIDVDIAQDLSGEGGGKMMNTQEVEELNKLKDARGKHKKASTTEKVGGALAILPNFGAHIQPLGPGGSITFGGSNLAAG